MEIGLILARSPMTVCRPRTATNGSHPFNGMPIAFLKNHADALSASWPSIAAMLTN
jgi:hypothetical protein